jgi:hypothetical protein
VRLALRLVNVAIALVTLASALAVLAADILDPGYRAHYRDAIWFVTLYAAIQVVMLVEFARGGRLIPWLALAKAVAAYFFLGYFTSLWPYWRTWTPARYVYQLFDWGEGVKVGLFALIFLGRGAFNTLNAMYWTRDWWGALRFSRPLVGRLVTAVPIGITAFCVWAFLQLTREEARTYSPEAQEVAQNVYESIECDAVRENAGKTTSDLRQQGERKYQVRIAYGCDMTRVVVQAEDGRVGAAAGPRVECCGGKS